jgi:predicted metal-dependent phosphoesterase TrpH
LESAIDFAKARNGVLIVPHPYRGGGIRDAARKIPVGLGAIEVMNPDSSDEENRLSESLAKTTNLPGVGGSDAHHVFQMWKAYTEVDADPNVDSILEAIRKGKVKAVLAKA